MMLAQVPGADSVIESASRSSWEAAAVAMILAVMLGGIGWLMRMLWQINQQLAERVTKLESTIEDRLMTIVEGTSAALTANTQMMERAATSIDKLEEAVERSMRTHDAMMARIEASPCLMENTLSEESLGRIEAAKAVARKTQE